MLKQILLKEGVENLEISKDYVKVSNLIMELKETSGDISLKLELKKIEMSDVDDIVKFVSDYIVEEGSGDDI